METTVMNVEGMTCNHCVMAVSGALKKISGVQAVSVSLEDGRVSIEHSVHDDAVTQFKQAIEDQGYDVV